METATSKITPRTTAQEVQAELQPPPVLPSHLRLLELPGHLLRDTTPVPPSLEEEEEQQQQLADAPSPHHRRRTIISSIGSILFLILLRLVPPTPPTSPPPPSHHPRPRRAGTIIITPTLRPRPQSVLLHVPAMLLPVQRQVHRRVATAAPPVLPRLQDRMASA